MWSRRGGAGVGTQSRNPCRHPLEEARFHCRTGQIHRCTETKGGQRATFRGELKGGEHIEGIRIGTSNRLQTPWLMSCTCTQTHFPWCIFQMAGDQVTSISPASLILCRCSRCTGPVRPTRETRRFQYLDQVQSCLVRCYSLTATVLSVPFRTYSPARRLSFFLFLLWPRGLRKTCYAVAHGT